MTTKLVYKTKDVAQIEWEDTDGQFGVLTIKYYRNGIYHVDAEYIGLDRLLKILKSVKE